MSLTGLSRGSAMDQATAGLIGVAVGGIISAITAVSTSLLTTRNQLRVERERAGIARHETLLQELRRYIAEVAREMLSAQHSMEWVCWHAQQAPNLINDELIAQYHREIHLVIPQLLGSLAVVASIDQQVYEELERLAEELYKVEWKIAQAFAHYKTSPQESLDALRACHPETIELYQRLPPGLSAIMGRCKQRLEA
jgi:hypothetical protein